MPLCPAWLQQTCCAVGARSGVPRAAPRQVARHTLTPLPPPAGSAPQIPRAAPRGQHHRLQHRLRRTFRNRSGEASTARCRTPTAISGKLISFFLQDIQFSARLENVRPTPPTGRRSPARRHTSGAGMGQAHNVLSSVMLTHANVTPEVEVNGSAPMRRTLGVRCSCHEPRQPLARSTGRYERRCRPSPRLEGAPPISDPDQLALCRRA